MKLLRILAPLSIFLSASVFAGGSLDLSVNDDTASLEYDATRMGTPLHISSGILHHEKDGNMLTVGVNAVDVRNQGSPFKIGIGGKLYGYFNDRSDSGALAVGGFVRYAPAELAGLGFAGHAYYAPSVLSFHTTDHLVDVGLRIEYRLLPTALVYLGYRLVEASDEDVDLEITKAGHFGLRINF